jgi:hypothetical protein
MLSFLGKSQYRRLLPGKKMPNAQKCSRQKNRRRTPNPEEITDICPSPLTVFNFAEKIVKKLKALFALSSLQVGSFEFIFRTLQNNMRN